MSKFLVLGMKLADIVRAVTVTPAKALGRPDLGDLSVGSTGDATVMRIENGDFTFTDVMQQTRQGKQRFALECVVVAGGLWHEAGAPRAALAAD